MSKKIPQWWPIKPPIYNIEKSYLENAEEGPFFDGEIPKRELPDESQWIDFLGSRIASPIGVPAGPLLNSRWVAFAAKMGFDVVTYKTIRSKSHSAHPVPNMIYVDTQGFLKSDSEGGTLKQAKFPPSTMDALAATNSFGIPSKDPDYLLKDIAFAKASLSLGQVLIVSVVGTPRPQEDFGEDFARSAQIAIEAGAEIIEADYSCPNVITCEGSIHTDPEAIFQISSKIRKVIGQRPLIIKIGIISNKERLQQVMVAAARAGVRAVCGINTVSMNVIKEDGTPALGSNRLRSGVCGGPIRQAALDFIQNAHQINRSLNLGLTLMATGGVTLPEHFDLFMEAGANIAMSAVGMMWDPFLAARYHQMRQAR
jgi:dihydroorotate dehydrogenase (NAD+) catalytic subunit